MQHPRSSTMLHDPTAGRHPAREPVVALLKGLWAVAHGGGTAADGETGDGAGVLPSIPSTLVPSSGCGRRVA